MTTMSVVALIGDIPSTTITLETRAAPTINAYGETVHPSATETEITAVVHPATSKQLSRVPEADRKTETIAVYYSATLQADGIRPYAVQYQDRRYEVIAHDDYLALGDIAFALAALIDEEAPTP